MNGHFHWQRKRKINNHNEKVSVWNNECVDVESKCSILFLTIFPYGYIEPFFSFHFHGCRFGDVRNVCKDSKIEMYFSYFINYIEIYLHMNFFSIQNNIALYRISYSLYAQIWCMIVWYMRSHLLLNYSLCERLMCGYETYTLFSCSFFLAFSKAKREKRKMSIRFISFMQKEHEEEKKRTKKNIFLIHFLMY